eukprot:246502-Pelagomonas_calceolata.AAC.4
MQVIATFTVLSDLKNAADLENFLARKAADIEAGIDGYLTNQLLGLVDYSRVEDCSQASLDAFASSLARVLGVQPSELSLDCNYVGSSATNRRRSLLADRMLLQPVKLSADSSCLHLTHLAVCGLLSQLSAESSATRLHLRSSAVCSSLSQLSADSSSTKTACHAANCLDKVFSSPVPGKVPHPHSRCGVGRIPGQQQTAEHLGNKVPDLLLSVLMKCRPPCAQDRSLLLVCKGTSKWAEAQMLAVLMVTSLSPGKSCWTVLARRLV